MLIHEGTIKLHNSLNSKMFEIFTADDHIEIERQAENIFLEDEPAASI